MVAATGHADTSVGHGELIKAVDRALTTHGRALLTGPAGAGKTEVVRAVAAAAEKRRETVLCLAPEAADQWIPEASAAALLASVPCGALEQLSGPQRTAIALLRREADAPRAGRDHIALRLAVVEVLRTLAARQPVLLVLDNAQWLDAESTDLLRFALRLTPPRVRVLVAECVQGGVPVGEPLCGPGVLAIRVPPLGADEVAELLLQHGLPARLAGRIHQASGGNPRLALALGHSLAEAAEARDSSAHHADTLPVSGQAREVARRLLAAAPAPARRTLLLAALATRPTISLLRRAGRPDAETELAEAERAALVRVGEDGTVEFTAGALPTALAADAGWPERAAGHAALAAAVDDPVQAVRHRALAVDTPDQWLATEITEAAAACRRRGQRALAAELGLLAAERTPSWLAGEELARLVTAAEDAGWAGRADLARRATRAVLARDASPADRVRARLAVIDAAGQQALGALDETFAHAMDEAAGDPSLQAAVQLRIAWKHNLSDGDPVRSRDAAARAGALAALGGDQVAEAMALTVRARMGRILGDPGAEAILAEALALPAPEVPLGMRNAPQYLAVRHALFDDGLDDARRQLMVLLPAVQRTGSAEDVFEVLRSLTEVELRSGRCEAASAHARRALDLTIDAGLSPGPAWYVAAMAEAMGGSFARAEGYARRGIQASQEEHDQVFLSRSLHALGLVELATGEAAKAVATLRRVAELEAAQQVVDPSILRWHGELAEALIAADAPDEAARLLASVRTVAVGLGRTGVVAALDRARGLCLSAQGDADAAVHLLETTAQRFDALQLPLERGRTLLALARVERRRRRRAPARAALRAAAEVFDRAGATPWTELAGEPAPGEIAGAQLPAAATLTDAETRLALLVSQGASNQEAAAKLFLSVKTVEARLTRIYQKLDVRSRAQLVTALRTR
ncbi:helix-turn-helix transcriptional regulator [Streptomyces avidinii]|uniref:DNA-binding CsgD family transcriptional regulator/energy-coupling factor transporter ATP-binding protein EcfA2 n=1 Tax=Streptomyces avidinii TaxID=1895 RepID=A0ABS4L4X1_STRAV|nr:LuxR family transcriptional regulator [Streptomyces avidinii]MBP2037161.1 DNA-binding CsgD family transcriptional regulator/energy-coupling factor transporter ATP-binding protein EcfA2 [Streptomyces avidinii]GGY95652.1 transcriptional regulator [Streptomyces avidinii]